MALRTRHWFILAAVGALLIPTVWLVDGRSALEKLILQLIAPTALVWIAITALTLHALAERSRRFAVLFAAWLLLSLFGNGWFASCLIRPLEAQSLDVDVFELPPLDAVVVLGGGLSEVAGGRIDLNEAGDRVVLAAQLFHLRRVGRIYCTGTRIATLAGGRTDPSQQAELVLTRLGIPPDVIVRVDGINTAEEMQHLAEVLPRDGRVGLITSAWHMPRALRLARGSGLELIPVPTDFATPAERSPPLSLARFLIALIPSSDALVDSRRASKEYLARLAGR